MKPDIIFFDLDGTLADSMTQIVEVIMASMEAYGVPREQIAPRLPDLLTLPANEMFAAILLLGGVDLVSMTPEESAAFMEEFLRGGEDVRTEPFPEVVEVLERLKARGITMFVTTNAPQASLADRLSKSGLDGLFRRVFGTSGGVFKGQMHIQLAAGDLGISVEELAARSALVGDSGSDMRMASEAGILAIGRLTGDNGERLRAAGANYLIKDLRELEPLLESL